MLLKEAILTRQDGTSVTIAQPCDQAPDAYGKTAFTT